MDYGKWSFKGCGEVYSKSEGNEGDVIIEWLKGDEVRWEECNELGLEVGEKIGGNDEVGV